MDSYAAKVVAKEVNGVTVRFKIGRSYRVASYDPVPQSYEVSTVVEEAYLLGTYYSGEYGKAYMKLYSERDGKVYVVYDPVGHRPYFLTDRPPEELREIRKLVEHPSFDSFEIVEKVDPLRMRRVTLTKVVVKDPLAVRELRNYVEKAYEAKIMYHHNYIYDLQLIPGMRYTINGGRSPKLRLR